ncbi:MAG TPA: hypothetical protein VKV05_14430 [Terriglobales bacterium]|nr:hypothetical protein [Terriglobales bacterium]
MDKAQCPACARLQEPRLICSFCGAPLAAELDCFAALGLPQRLTLDPAQLEHLYHDLGRRLHPDRFANQPAAVQAASLKSTALLTRAFRTLREPVSRGLYWLELRGEKLSADNKQVPPTLVELIFELQEALAELRTAAPAERDGLVAAMRQRRQELTEALAGALRELTANFARWDEGGDPVHLTRELKEILSHIAYLRSVLRDVDRELGDGTI